jgi:regulator of protease activity HflC (stomatin/prohibitin superfamily)
MFFFLQTDPNPIVSFISNYWWVLILLFIVFSGLFTVNQGYIGVITMFGKYQRVVRPGLNIKIPILDKTGLLNWSSRR